MVTIWPNQYIDVDHTLSINQVAVETIFLFFREQPFNPFLHPTLNIPNNECPFQAWRTDYNRIKKEKIDEFLDLYNLNMSRFRETNEIHYEEAAKEIMQAIQRL